MRHCQSFSRLIYRKFMERQLGRSRSFEANLNQYYQLVRHGNAVRKSSNSYPLMWMCAEFNRRKFYLSFRAKTQPAMNVRKQGKPLYRRPKNDHLAKNRDQSLEVILIIVMVVLAVVLSTVIIPNLLSPLESNCQQLDKYCPQ
jgi:hypothetical protein